MDRINGADWVDIGGGRRGFRDEDLPNGIIGTEVEALWLNSVQEEMLKLIESSSLAPNAALWDLLAKSVQSQRVNYAAVGGTANALTLTLPLAPGAYRLGMVVRFVTGAAANTAAMTVDVNGLGAVALVTSGGAAIAAGQVVAGAAIEAIYDGAAFRTMRSLPATAAMVAAGSSAEAVITALSLFDRKSPYFLATGSALQSIPVGVDTKVTNLTTVAGSYFNAGSSFANSEFICGAKDAGAWMFMAYSALILLTSTSAGNEYRGAIARNGATGPFSSAYINPSNTYGLVVTNPFIVSAGDVVDLRVFQNTQTTRNISATQLFGLRLGAV